MFKFDFKVDQDDSDNEKFFVGSDPKAKESNKEVATDGLWYDSEEIVPSEDVLENMDVCKLNSETKDLKDGVSLFYIVSGFLLEDIKNNDDQTTDLKKAEENHSDLIPAIYEGGAKIWECTDDLLMYMAESFTAADWEGKSVLDLGCGAGLLGIYAFKKGAMVTFQDYNKDVLEKITIPNILINTLEMGDCEDEIYNLEKVKEKARFYSGDWQKWSDATKNSQLYDIILTCETIYNPQNQQKLLNCMCDKLKTDGQVLVAAKTYYFGVGGGLRQFESLIEKDNRFDFKSVWLSNEGVNREIIQMNKKRK